MTYFPAAQSLQATLPAEEVYRPARQLTQDDWPCADWYWPLGHDTQAVLAAAEA